MNAFVLQLNHNSFLVPFSFRTVAMLTVLLVSAWFIARVAGPHHAALRSSIWTSSIAVSLLIPWFSIAGPRLDFELVQIPNHWTFLRTEQCWRPLNLK